MHNSDSKTKLPKQFSLQKENYDNLWLQQEKRSLRQSLKKLKPTKSLQ